MSPTVRPLSVRPSTLPEKFPAACVSKSSASDWAEVSSAFGLLAAVVAPSSSDSVCMSVDAGASSTGLSLESADGAASLSGSVCSAGAGASSLRPSYSGGSLSPGASSSEQPAGITSPISCAVTSTASPTSCAAASDTSSARCCAVWPMRCSSSGAASVKPSAIAAASTRGQGRMIELPVLEARGEVAQDFDAVAHHTVGGMPEDGRLRVGVDCDDALRPADAGQVLDGA